MIVVAEPLGPATRYGLSPPGPAAVTAPAFGARVQLKNYCPGEYSWSMLPVVSVPLTLLGLLERGPSHGYDLKRDYDTYFGRGQPL
jgi:hypothetical protein